MLRVWVDAFHSSIALLSVSAIKTLPADPEYRVPATATPPGAFRPEETRVMTVWVDAFHSSIALLSVSAM